MGFTRPLWTLLGHHGFHYAIVGFTRPLWILLDHNGFYWAILEFTRAFMEFTNSRSQLTNKLMVACSGMA